MLDLVKIHIFSCLLIISNSHVCEAFAGAWDLAESHPVNRDSRKAVGWLEEREYYDREDNIVKIGMSSLKKGDLGVVCRHFDTLAHSELPLIDALKGEIALYVRRDIVQAQELFKSLETVLGLFYLWLLDVPHRSDYALQISAQGGEEAERFHAHLTELERCLKMPFNTERISIAKRFIQNALNILTSFWKEENAYEVLSLINTRVNVYVLLCHCALFPPINHESIFDHLNGNFEANSFRCIVASVYAQAGKIRSNFLHSVYFVKLYLVLSNKFYRKYLEKQSAQKWLKRAHAEAYLYLIMCNAAQESDMTTLWDLHEKKADYKKVVKKGLSIPEVLMGELVYLKEQRAIPADGPTELQKQIIKGALAYFLRCTEQDSLLEIKIYALVRIGQCHYLMGGSAAIEKALDYVYRAHACANEGAHYAYLKKWSALTIFAMNSKEKIPRQVLFQMQNLQDYETINERIQSQLKIDGKSGSNQHYFKMVLHFHHNRFIRQAARAQLLGYKKYGS